MTGNSESLGNPQINQAEEKNTFTLLPHTFRNVLFNQNLAYFQEYQPAFFQAIDSHKCTEYRLCHNAKGITNILHIPSKKPVYAGDKPEELINPIRKQIDSLYCFTQIDPAYFDEAPEKWKKNSPIQAKMFNSLYHIGIFSELKLCSAHLTPLHGYCTDYLPMIRVYGIGLGYHISELLQQKNISYMLVYEPNFDLFYTSLYTIPWNLIFQYFEVNNKGINLALACTPDEAINSHSAFIEQRLTPMTTLFYRYNHYNNSPLINDAIKLEPEADNVQRHQMDSGWYEDQRIGFYFAARNIINKNKIYNGSKIKRYFRAFIVGSGPSLNESIQYIKDHCDDAVIISCGSAIDPLLSTDIVPDYEVIQERNWHTMHYEENHDLEILKQIKLLKLNVVSTKIDPFYNEVLVFQKFRDPGSVILEADYPLTADVNPTVTNAAIAMAAELGANEVYLFGVDYGAPINETRMHARNTIYDDSENDVVSKRGKYTLPGNLGSEIKTDSIFSWSLDTTQLRIRKHPNIQWYNVGEGARINGTVSIAASGLPDRFSKKIQKRKIIDEISKCFDNNYETQNIFNRLNTYYVKQVEDFFDALLSFQHSTPKTRDEMISTLSLMYQASCIGDRDKHFLPASLLSRGIKQFIKNVYIQVGLYKSDEKAAIFFSNAIEVLKQHIADINNDLLYILQAQKDDEEIDLL